MEPMSVLQFIWKQEQSFISWFLLFYVQRSHVLFNDIAKTKQKKRNMWADKYMWISSQHGQGQWVYFPIMGNNFMFGQDPLVCYTGHTDIRKKQCHFRNITSRYSLISPRYPSKMGDRINIYISFVQYLLYVKLQGCKHNVSFVRIWSRFIKEWFIRCFLLEESWFR